MYNEYANEKGGADVPPGSENAMNLKEFQHLAEDGLWTEAFRAAMNALTSEGGGTLTVPAGPVRNRAGIVKIKYHAAPGRGR